MTQYSLRPSNFQPGMVGQVYNIGLSDGTQSYGYVFANDGQQSTGMVESSNVADKQALIQYSSSALIDRDLVYYPRVTQGDYSNGGLQTVLLDQTKYWDSDLDIRTPGYLTLRPGWHRTTLLAGVGGPTYQCASYQGNIYTVWGASQFFDAFGTGRTTTPAINPKLVDSDGNVLFMADGVDTLLEWSVTSNTYALQSNAIGAISQMWFINLGTGGRFIYYTIDGSTLNRWDLNAGSAAAVPVGNQFWSIIDVCVYQSGVAIATRGVQGTIVNGGYSDIWYHDGQNLTRITTLDEYEVVGLTNCLGVLYATCNSTGNYESPILVRIDSGGITVAARPGSPLVGATSAQIGAPTSSGQYVYFALVNPQIVNITTTPYIGVYDSITGSFSHLPNLSPDDAPQALQTRQIACSGRAAGFPMTDSGGNAVIQTQNNSSLLPVSSPYMFSGTLVSSKIDFATPGVPKRFRRIEVQHSPLATGESITVQAFLDSDPLGFSSALTPIPPSATVTNSTVGSSQTLLTFGVDTVGKTLYYSLNLGGGGTTTPRLNYVAVEIGGTWVWNFTLDCSSKRRTLSQPPGTDPQGVNGKDLYYLIRNAYENGTNLILYLAQGVSYTAAIQTVKAKNIAYSVHKQEAVQPDEEWSVEVTLNQVASS